MRFEKDRLGYVFVGDYPEFYGPADAARLRAIVSVQAGRLSAADPVADARIIGILTGRRCGDQERPQLEQRARRDGSYSIVARGEVVLPARQYDAGTVNHLLDGFTALKGGGGERVCLRRPSAAPADVDRVIDSCAGVKVPAWPNYLATMASIGKGIGGPEPAPAPPPPPPPAVQSVAAAKVAAPVSGPAPAAGSAPTAGSGKAPIVVAVIDTGLPERRRADGWLDIQRTPGDIDLLDVLPAGPDGLLDYAAGHGAFVTGIVQRVAPQATVRMYRAADTDGFATDHDIAEAILRAHADGAQVINLSLGIRTVDDTAPPAIAHAVRKVLADSGNATVIVAAAGNHGDTSTVWPAALPGVESVAGLTAYLTPADWSNYGPGVTFSTVGEGIRSTYVTGRESPVFDPEPDEFDADAWAVWSGTSFAAPQIAAAIARVAAELGRTPREAADHLAAYGKPIAGYGKAVRILEGIG